MLTTTADEQHSDLGNKVRRELEESFPIEDPKGQFEVSLKKVKIGKGAEDIDDIQGQLSARTEGKTWASPITATLQIKDKATGKVLIEKPNHSIGSVPRTTRHFTYIVGGKEKTLTNQWRLRPGPYIKPTDKPDEIRAQFQLAKGPAFKIDMDPKKGDMWMSVKGRKIPMYSVLQSQGITDDQMKDAWGEETFSVAKKKANPEKNLQSLYEVWKGRSAAKGTDLNNATKDLFSNTKMDADIAERNLGVRSDKVNGKMLLAATKKMRAVSAGTTKADPIDSLEYKELWTPSDHIADRIRLSRDNIRGRVMKSLSKPSVQRAIRAKDPNVVRDVFLPDLVKKPVYGVFATSLAGSGGQTNPISLLGDRSATTIAGPGGISNANAISESNTAIDPSHMGFIDPTYTPEGDPGVTTHLAAGVVIKDRKPHVRMFNVKTGKPELIDAAKAARSNVVLPDQVKWKDGKPVAVRANVRVNDNAGEIRDAKWKDADYVLPDAGQVFSTETNLVPFMQNDSAGRTTMSARHLGQAISITGREAPLVQSVAGRKSQKTYEEHIGSTFMGHPSKVDGKVVSVKKGAIVVEDSKGKRHTTQIYDHYPLNDAKAQVTSTPLVKVGDKVKANQTLADNSFTKDGVLALGTNLRTAYLASGSNHEDGITISESAAKKLSSEHLYKPSLHVGEGIRTGKKAFLSHRYADFEKDKYDNIGEDGVIAVGTKVKPGDPLVLALNEVPLPQGADEKARRRLQKRFRDRYTSAAQTWDADHEGEVVRVSRSGKNVVVHVKTVEPMQVGSKLSTRHAAKGIVSEIRPDADMPHDEKGTPVQVLLNPVGVPGRMNAGQVLETAAGKIAEKTGKPYKVKNFETGVDYLEQVKKDLKKHGLSETETLTDPTTGRKLKDISVGPHYMVQLKHQIDKKTQARGGGWVPEGSGAPPILYDTDNQQPKGGGKTGAQAIGTLGMYGAIASGLKHNIQEMQTLRSDSEQAADAWDALTNGTALPTPKVPFAYKKFETLLRGAGINLEKNGTEVQLTPQTDKQVLDASLGELKRPNLTVRAKDDAPMKGGLYDYEKTGGPQGKHWSHITLAEPMPNPVFAKPVEHLLGLKHGELPKVISGESKLSNGKHGGKAIRDALAKVDVDKELEATYKELHDPKTKEADVTKLHDKYRALKLLKDKKLKPHEAYTMKHVPVIPPVMRPMTRLADGTSKISPTTDLYRRLGIVNQSLKSGEGKVPYDSSTDTRLGLYQELQNLMGTTAKGSQAASLDVRGTREDPGKRLPGILHQIHGAQPKSGFFQSKVLGKKMDYTARVPITGDPSLSMDEIGVPKKVAAEVYRPMITRRLIQAGYDPAEAHKMISKKDPIAMKHLEKEVAERPVLMKRDPVLHQHSIIGQNIKLTDSPSVKVSPLVMPQMGADVDGDTVTLMAPLSKEAIQEVKNIMPSARPINPSSGDVMSVPANESALSLYRMSIPRGEYKGKIKDAKHAEELFYSNKLDLNNKITVPGVGKTTLGRIRASKTVPEKYRKDVLTKLDKPLDRKWQKDVIQEVAKKGSPAQFRDTADKMSQLGFKMAYESGHSVTLKDITPQRATRDAIIREAAPKARALQAKGDTEGAKKVWIDATKKMHTEYEKRYAKSPTNVSDMATAGIKAKREQFQGILMAPMLVENHRGEASKAPITKSFAEGVDLGGYFLQASGARRGLLQKVKATSRPGFFSKNLMHVSEDQNISGDDCGTPQGLLLSVKERDIIDRHTASPITIKGKTVKPGTLITPEMARDMASAKVKNVPVRSPLKCRQPQGVCAKCMGKHPEGRDYHVGEPVGIVSAHAIGERATQLMLKQTHAAGIVSTSPQTLDEFGKVESLFSSRPKNERHAQLASGSGQVTSVARRAAGGWDIGVVQNGRKKALYSRQAPMKLVKPGYKYKKGDQLSAGDPHMGDVLKTRGFNAMQNQMADTIGGIYSDAGVLRRHAEMAVRNSTSLMKVTDPGGYNGFVRGDQVKKQVIDELNRTTLKGKKPIKMAPMMTSIEMQPLRGQPDWMGRLGGSRISETIQRAAQQGHKSNLEGEHPVPTLARGGFLRNLFSRRR